MPLHRPRRSTALRLLLLGSIFVLALLLHGAGVEDSLRQYGQTRVNLQGGFPRSPTVQMLTSNLPDELMPAWLLACCRGLALAQLAHWRAPTPEAVRRPPPLPPLPAGRPAWLPAWGLPASLLPACLPVCLAAGLTACRPHCCRAACRPAWLPGCRPGWLSRRMA